MEIFITAIFILVVTALLFFIWASRRKKPGTIRPIPVEYKEILQKDVPFYQKLDNSRKNEFESRMMHFLAKTRITGVRTRLEDIDKVYIAASAIIPIFGFPGWEYNNLNEVLVYPDSFNHDFDQAGSNRSILGIVGEGAYQHIMILSQQQLRLAFSNKSGKDNTAIHEFVHLIDKSDGTTDGLPELFLDKKYVVPWLQLIEKGMQDILSNRSDIDPYGTTNEAEFFAVVSEYFFERPELLDEKHPELYKLLTEVFRQKPGIS